MTSTKRVPAPTKGRRRAAAYGLLFGEPPPRRQGPPARARKPAGRVRPPNHRAVAPDSRRPHGTYAKYVAERCGCELCRAANSVYGRRRRRAIFRPDEVWLPYVDADPARAHLASLSAEGVGLKTVSRLSGVSHGTLTRLVYGERARGQQPSRRVRPETRASILRVGVEEASGAQKVPAGPTWALLEELVAAGYSKGFLARALGSRAANPALQVGRDRVRASTARAVETLHRRLIDQKPPPRRGRWWT